MPLKLRRRARRDDLDVIIAAQLIMGRAVNQALADAIERIEAQDKGTTR